MPQHVVDSGSVDTSVTMADPALITHDDAADVFCDALRRRVGRGADKVSVSDLADHLDMDARTVRAWRDGETVPQWHAMLRLFAVLGPDFANEVMAPSGLGGTEALAPHALDPMGITAEMAGAVSHMTDLLRDNVFCHRDRATMEPILRRLAVQLEAQANAMKPDQ